MRKNKDQVVKYAVSQGQKPKKTVKRNEDS